MTMIAVIITIAAIIKMIMIALITTKIIKNQQPTTRTRRSTNGNYHKPAPALWQGLGGQLPPKPASPYPMAKMTSPACEGHRERNILVMIVKRDAPFPSPPKKYDKNINAARRVK